MSDAFDKAELLEELDDDFEFLAESIEVLDSDAPDLLGQVRSALTGGDAEALRVGAHTLKSMVGNFSAQPAFDSALKVEMLGHEGDLSSAAEAVSQLEQEVQRLQVALHAFLKENQ